MRRQDNNRRRPSNDNRFSKNPGGQRGMFGMQPGLLGQQSALMGVQGGLMGQGSLLGSHGSLFGSQGSLLGAQAGFLGGQGGGLMGGTQGLLRNQIGALESMGISGQEILNNPNLLGMLNRNVSSLLGSQLNGAGQGFGSLQGFGGNQGDGIASLLGDPLGGKDRMRAGDWMGSSPNQAGILGPPPDTRRVMPLLSGDDSSLRMGMGGKRSYEDDGIQMTKRFQSGGVGQLMSPTSYQGSKQGTNSSRSKDNTCNICNWSYSTTYMVHCQTLDHKRRAKLVNKGCLLCKTGKFKNYPEYVKHLDSSKHKQKKEELNRDLDAKKKLTEQGKSGKQQEETSTAKEKSNGSKVKQEVNIDKDYQDTSVEDVKMDDVADGDCDSFSKADSLVYDPNVAVGQEHVISVTGYFCKLCRKFYNNETMAKVTHCKAEAHFEKYRDALRLK